MKAVVGGIGEEEEKGSSLAERDVRPEWATVCRWIDAGCPDLSLEGDWLLVDGEGDQMNGRARGVREGASWRRS